MATTFLEPGGDATFNVALTSAGGLWGALFTTPSIATDFVHGSHIKSISYRPGFGDAVETPVGVIADSGTRGSVFIYLNALPSSTTTIISYRNNGGNAIAVRLTSGGVLQLWNAAVAQVGSNGSTLSTGVWYRLCVAYTVTSTTINEIRLFKDGTIDISVTNGTFAGTGFDRLRIGNVSTNSTLDIRTSDLYVDNSSALTDTGQIWVTAKRPNANGTTNGFTTQIGSGGSGYGTGHSPQVNERALSTTNGWSIVGAGSAVTEEYNIENLATGDINLTGAVIIDYMGWVSAKTLSAETASIIVNNVTSNISLTTTITVFTKIAGSASYPAGTGTDIGIITTTALTTVSLYEAGIIVAYRPTGISTSSSVSSSPSSSVSPSTSVSSSVSSSPSSSVSPSTSVSSSISSSVSSSISSSVSSSVSPSTSVSSSISHSPSSSVSPSTSVSSSISSSPSSSVSPSTSISSSVSSSVSSSPSTSVSSSISSSPSSSVSPSTSISSSVSSSPSSSTSVSSSVSSSISSSISTSVSSSISSSSSSSVSSSISSSVSSSPSSSVSPSTSVSSSASSSPSSSFSPPPPLWTEELKNSSTFSNQTKHSSSFSNSTKHTSSFSNQSKNTDTFTNADTSASHYFFLIDDTFSFLIDNTHKLLIETVGGSIWTDAIKST